MAMCRQLSSSASRAFSGGMILMRRFASMLLPVPGGPLSSKWCPPTALMSSIRFAVSSPSMSDRSPFVGSSTPVIWAAAGKFISPAIGKVVEGLKCQSSSGLLRTDRFTFGYQDFSISTLEAAYVLIVSSPLSCRRVTARQRRPWRRAPSEGLALNRSIASAIGCPTGLIPSAAQRVPDLSIFFLGKVAARRECCLDSDACLADGVGW